MCIDMGLIWLIYIFIFFVMLWPECRVLNMLNIYSSKQYILYHRDSSSLFDVVCVCVYVYVCVQVLLKSSCSLNVCSLTILQAAGAAGFGLEHYLSSTAVEQEFLVTDRFPGEAGPEAQHENHLFPHLDVFLYYMCQVVLSL